MITTPDKATPNIIIIIIIIIILLLLLKKLETEKAEKTTAPGGRPTQSRHVTKQN